MKNVMRFLFVGVLLTLSILAAAQAQQRTSIPFCWQLCEIPYPPYCDSEQPGICYCDESLRLGDCPSYCIGLCGA